MGVLDRILTPMMGVSRNFGTLWARDGKPAIEILAIGDAIMVHIYKGDEKFYTIELTADTAFKFAELIQRGAAHVAKSGGSPLPAVRTIIPN